MVKTLVAIEVDLASSYAIRYACKLGSLIQMEIHPIYVKFPSPEIPMTGVGWVRHTWEREVVEMGKAEIQEVLASETDSCPRLQEPRVIYGDREIELLNVVEHEPFDLYIEGAPYPFNPATIYKRLHAKFYQHLKCPLIWLRSVRKIDRVVAVFSDPANTGPLVEALGCYFGGSDVPLSLAYAGDGGNFDMRLVAEKAVTDLTDKGCQVTLGEVYPVGTGGPPPKNLKDAGLVAVALERGVRKEDHQVQWLAQVNAPLLLVLL
jgi:hypothetical protein|uniref:Universal stress protein n=1 Tax=Desulfobacca acetoxidans TaxID=60893 RepID=A0A7V6A274_9BACT